jgi:hypothetical protein
MYLCLREEAGIVGTERAVVEIWDLGSITTR